MLSTEYNMKATKLVISNASAPVMTQLDEV